MPHSRPVHHISQASTAAHASSATGQPQAAAHALSWLKHAAWSMPMTQLRMCGWSTLAYHLVRCRSSILQEIPIKAIWSGCGSMIQQQ